MKRRVSVLVATLAITTAVAGAQTLVCGRAARPPVIDATLGDACWSDAMIATDFAVLGSAGTQRAFRQTTVRASWDDAALHLHVIALEPDPTSITADVTRRDGTVWLEDAIEVFLLPDTSSASYLHLIVNAVGTLYDERGSDPTWDSQARIATEIGEQAWQVEIAIPWSDLGGRPAPGDEWGFNVGREHRPADPREWSTWAPLAERVKQFGLPEMFGRLRLSDAPEAGRVSGLTPPEGLAVNPDFTDLDGDRPASWGLSSHSSFGEVTPGSRHYFIRNDGDYGIASQRLDLPVQPAEFFTVFAVIRGGGGATRGIAVVQEMEDGQPDDLYPFWNAELTEDFRLYVGRIKTDAGVKRLQKLNLYRPNRKGWIEYAYVQVLPGIHGLAALADVADCTRDYHRGEGDPWPTPALPCFKPLPDGPLRALLFIGEFQRDAVELAQRLDLDYDLIYCPKLYRGGSGVEQNVALEPAALMGRLGRGEYDVIILGGPVTGASLADDVLDAVRAGAGLVTIAPIVRATQPEHMDRLLTALNLETAALPTTLTDTLVATGEGQATLETGQLGEGRTARLSWPAKVMGLIPMSEGVCEYWEYRWAALARTVLWAAGREQRTRIATLECGDELVAEISGPAGVEVAIQPQWDTRFGVSESAPIETVIGADGRARVTVPMPAPLKLVRGPVIARALLTQAGAALDFASCPTPMVEPAIALGEIAAPREVAPEETLAVEVTYAAATEGTLRAELVDAFDRVVDRAEIAAETGDERAASFALTMREPLSVYHRVVVTARVGETIVDRATSDVFVPRANADHLTQFRLGAGYASMHVRCSPWLHGEMVSFLRAHGVEAATVNEYMIKRGMMAFGGTIGGGMAYKGASNVREPSFCDPAQVQALADRTVEKASARQHWGFFGFNMTDEVHLHQSTTVEVDASEHALAAWREWSRDCYGTIAAANEEWGTGYASFDELPVPLLADMRGETNPARWVDFRLFMERVWADAYIAAQRAVRERFPDVAMSFTNPYKYDSLSGSNFALWTPHEQVLLRYCHRHVMDRNHSWSHAPILSWFGYRSDPAASGNFVWNFALGGGTVVYWWDPIEPWAYGGKDGFTPWNLFGPLWRETGRSRPVTASAEALELGIGKLLRVADPEPAEALVVHSQPSMHVLYAEAAMPGGAMSREGYKRYAASDEALARGLMRRAMSYRYTLPEDLEADLEGARLVALPSCVALPDEAVAALRDFVAGGGRLLADIMPATHDEHGAPRAGGSPLADLFDAEAGVCLGASATKDSAAAIDQAMDDLEASGAMTWQTADGSSPVDARMYGYRMGAARYLGLVRYPAGGDESGPVTIDLPREMFTHDCVTGEALGRTDRLTLDIPADGGRFLALLPYELRALTVQARAEELALTVDVELRTSGGTPAPHVLHIEVTPAGADAPAYHYTRNAVARHGEATVSIPLAHSDPTGEWTVTATDVATGLSGSASVQVGLPENEGE